MGKHGEQFIIILDVNKVFTVEELSRAKETGGILDALEEDGKGVAEESGPPESRRKSSSRKKASAGKTPKKKEKKQKIPS
ncbi:hypothetical protein BMS3Abin14_00229 [bacterium BMS3Abin14]|nr:hypothetical protein BMS3Abin14_00229 [bacterium BMS3Abin14]